MEFSIQRESLLGILQPLVSVVDKRQTLPILSNLLLSVNAERQQLSITATDLEVELVGRTDLLSADESGDLTVPAKKLMDISRSLPDGQEIKIVLSEQKVSVKSGRSRFTLSTLPAVEYPSLEEGPGVVEFNIAQKDLSYLINMTHFAMAHQDVRYYLNGILLELKDNKLRAVATDGHRLAVCSVPLNLDIPTHQVIVPRKGILELMRLLHESDENVLVSIGTNHLHIQTEGFTFTSKLIDGRFPDYEKVLPKGGDKTATLNREELKNALARASILCNEKFKGVRLQFSDDLLTILASNPEHEEAEEQMEINYTGESVEIGFNAKYLQDVLNTISSDPTFTFSDSNSSVLVQESTVSDCVYVVMPMRI